MIDVNKKYTTRDGRPVRILATDLKNTDYPVAITVNGVNGEEMVGMRTINGSWYTDGRTCSDDLIEVKPRIKRTIWVNVYPVSGCNVCLSREDADQIATSYRIACVKVDLDVEYGHGLIDVEHGHGIGGGG